MRHLAKLLALSCVALGLLAAPAQAAFGLKGLDLSFLDDEGNNAAQAGSHPAELTNSLAVETKPEPILGFPVPDEELEDLTVNLPPGLAGDPTAVPRCTTIEFLTNVKGGNACPAATALGEVDITYADPETHEVVSVHNLVPPPGTVLRLGFTILGVPVVVEVSVKPTPPYNPVARVTNITQAVPFHASELTLFGTPGEDPFLTSPRACEGPLTTRFDATSWQGSAFSEEILTHDDAGAPQGFIGCGKLGFEPDVEAMPTTDQAESPSGLEFSLHIEDENLANPDGYVNSDIEKTVVTLPEGMTLNPSVAEGLEACSEEDFQAEDLDGGRGCPQASKVGTVEAETPLLKGEIVKGSLYVAEQEDNPFNSLIALYMVLKHPDLGILVKLAGRVEPDPETGQIVTSFGDEPWVLPQFPLSDVRVKLREGGRSPLISPKRCGVYEIKTELTPYANPGRPFEVDSSFRIAEGVGGSPCPPGGAPPFSPGFAAGSLNNLAGAHSPFLMRLTRPDGHQELTRFDAILPRGLTAKLAGVAQCPDAGIAFAKSKTGREELTSPSCPLGSQIGTVIGGAGVGSQLTFVRGAIYLAGPVGAAPLSVVGIVPAVAGPFDVGNVVVRQALTVDPRNAEVKVDGALSDPIPHILAGIPLRVRDIRVHVDRPAFSLNPTSCAPKQTVASIWGAGNSVFSVADDFPAILAARFQAADCAALAFKPRLGIRLKGSTKRGGHPALRAAYVPRPGDANLRRMALTFPRSAFVENANFRTICTRVQFASAACPRGSIYGRVRAWTPLLDQPLEGPVYLRSSDNLLPDAIFDLRGLIDAEVAIRIDSLKGRLRATVYEAPDVPVSRVVVQMQAGRRGLFVNSRGLCRGANRGTARSVAHNNRRVTLRPRFRPEGCSKRRSVRRAKHR